MLELKDLTIRLSKRTIVDHVTCGFAEGVHCILGPNGAGKTTMIRGMLGLYRRRDEMVSLNGGSFQPSEVGYLPQQFGMFPNMTVREALIYFGNMKKISGQQLEEEVVRCVDEVNLTDKLDEKVAKLSGGMVRRLGIAQAILGNPEILVFDEPTVGLDPEERLRIKNLLKGMKKGRIVLISTHLVDDAEYLCDYIEIMNAGSIRYQGTPDDMRKQVGDMVVEMSGTDLPENAYLVKEYERDGKKYMRVLTKEAGDYLPLEPTLEDGYLCILKNMC